MPLTYISRSTDFENFYVEVLSTFTSKFGFLEIRDSCESETLHSNCPWHTLQACTLTQCPWPIFHGPLTLIIFTSKFGFLDIRDSCKSETLHSNCPWHTLQARTLTLCPWPIFHGQLTLKIFTSKFGFSTSEIAACLKPCIVIVLDMPFKHAPWPSALELYFTVYWLCPMQVRYRPPRSSCFTSFSAHTHESLFYFFQCLHTWIFILLLSVLTHMNLYFTSFSANTCEGLLYFFQCLHTWMFILLLSVDIVSGIFPG